MKHKLMVLVLLLTGCKTVQQVPEAKPFDFPSPVNTEDQPISLQQKQIFLKEASPIQATNDFDGARLNDFTKVNDSTFRALILPENEPINPSPWYAFKLWSAKPATINLILDYLEYHHRYPPKISADGQKWQQLNADRVALNHDSTEAHIQLSLSADTLWVAAQEILTTRSVANWCANLTQHPMVSVDTVGWSVMGRPLLEVSIGSPKSMSTVVILSRQHPPEVTGFMALQGFLERILDDNDLSLDFLKQFRILVYPLMNPDGADLGHWRHNAHGIDMNRDWAYYRQTEVKQVADRIVSTVAKHESKVVLGLDFHSTYHDVYYTNTMDNETSLPKFTGSWLASIESELEDYELRERASGLGKPVSKGWFFTQFQAVGITYEIGDGTDRDFVKRKGEISADSMMDLLLGE